MFYSKFLRFFHRYIQNTVHITLLGCDAALSFDIFIQYCLGVYFFHGHSVVLVSGNFQ